MKSLYSKEFPFRINLKNEKRMKREDESVQEIIHMLPNLQKFMRYKKRYSFITPDNLFRIDISAVKSGKGLDFVKSKILESREEYEIEIEFIGAEYRVGDELSIDVFLNLFYSNDKEEMEKYEIQYEKLNYGNSINSDIYHLGSKIEKKEGVISENCEYQEKDISKN